MSFEVCLDSVDVDKLDECYGLLHSNVVTAEENLHEAIFFPPGNSHLSIQVVSLKEKLSDIESKTQSIARNHRIAPTDSVSGEIGGTISWGGEDGVQGSGYVSGSASDDNGNKVDVTVEVNSDGSGNASISATHEEKTD